MRLVLNGRFLFFLIILILDLLTKYWAKTYLVLGQPLVIIPDIFNLTLVYNPGAAFGMFAALPDFWRRLTLWSVSFVALLVVLRYMYNEAKDDLVSRYALSGILAGAFGNILDRYRMDRVIDFLDFYWGNYHWPAFNVADSMISIGVFTLVLRMFFAQNKKHETRNVG